MLKIRFTDNSDSPNRNGPFCCYETCFTIGNRPTFMVEDNINVTEVHHMLKIRSREYVTTTKKKSIEMKND